MKLDKAVRREKRQRKAKARRTMRVHSRDIRPLQSKAAQDAALALVRSSGGSEPSTAGGNAHVK